MSESREEEATNTVEEGGAGTWGLSSVSAAFGGWGISTSSSTVEDKETVGADDTTTETTNKNLILSNEAEEVLDETAKIAAKAAFSFFDDASNLLSSAYDAAAQTQIISSEQSAPSASAAANEEEGEQSSSLQTAAFGMFKDASDIISSAYTNNNNINSTAETITKTEEAQEQPTLSAQEQPDALSSFLEYNPLNSLASSWINDLEHKSNSTNNTSIILQNHLEQHLLDWPKCTYEEWVEVNLSDMDINELNVIDDTFYEEECVHRIVWNERMAKDDPNVVGGEGGGVGVDEWRDRYVKARTTKQTSSPMKKREEVVGAVQPSTEDGREGGTTTSNDELLVVKSTTTAVAKTGADDNDDDDLDNLLSETSYANTPSQKGTAADKNNNSILSEASALLSADENDVDADLDGLLNDDDEGEVVFVSTP